jgi:hypothetical protein
MKFKKLICVNLIFAILVLLSSACTVVEEVQPVDEESGVTPEPAVTVISTPTEIPIPDGYVAYESQSGDTIPAIAAHFGVDAGSIITLADLESGTYNAGFTDGGHDHTTQEAHPGSRDSAVCEG